MAAKIVDKDFKRRAIVEAALRTFAAKGVARTRMADIAAAAEIGKGTIYEYFRSKEEVFAAVFHHFFQQVDEMIATRIFKITDPEQKLRALFRSFIQITREYPEELVKIILDFWAEGVRHRDEERTQIFDLEKMYHDYRQVIAAILEEGIRKKIFRPDLDPYYVASSLLGASDGLWLQLVMLGPDRFDFEKAINTLLDMSLQGLKMPAETP